MTVIARSEATKQSRKATIKDRPLSTIIPEAPFLIINPDHPSLRTEKLYKGAKKDIRASSISMGIRLIWQIKGDTIKLINVGGHDIYRQY